MNALVVGQSTKMADILSQFCDNVYIVIDVNASGLRYSPELEDYHVIRSSINMLYYYNIIPKARYVKRLIKEYKIDIVFSQTKYDMVAAKFASVLLGHKVVLLGTSHNSYSWINKAAVQKMSWLIKLSTDCFVALASFVYNQLIELGIPQNRLLLMPNTIEYDAWKKKEDYDCKGTFRMAYVAFVYPGKQQSFLVDLLKDLIYSKGLDVEIDCYGDSEKYAEYVNHVNSKIKDYNLSEKFHLKGRVDNSTLRSLLCEYDAYICPSQMEMSPVNILEAKAAGLPIISTNVGGIPDLIKDNYDGLLFNFGDVKTASEKVSYIINNKGFRELLGNNARTSVSKEYTAKEAGVRLEQIISCIKNTQ